MPDDTLQFEDLLEDTLVVTKKMEDDSTKQAMVDEAQRQMVENTFRPVSDDLTATIQDRERAEDKELGEVYRKVKEIHETVQVEPPRQAVKGRNLWEKAAIKTLDWAGYGLAGLFHRVNRLLVPKDARDFLRKVG